MRLFVTLPFHSPSDPLDQVREAVRSSTSSQVTGFPTNRDLTSVYYIIFSYELAPGCFIRAGEGPIEIGCRADQCEMRERLRKVSEMLAVRPKFL